MSVTYKYAMDIVTEKSIQLSKSVSKLNNIFEELIEATSKRIADKNTKSQSINPTILINDGDSTDIYSNHYVKSPVYSENTLIHRI